MSLRRRTTLAAIVLVITTGTLVGLLTIHQLRKTLEAEDLAWSGTMAQAVAKAVTEATLRRDKVTVRDVLRRVKETNDELNYLLVVDFQGRVFASSFNSAIPPPLNGDHSDCSMGSLSHITVGGMPVRDISYPLIQGLDAHLHIGISEAKVANDLNDTTATIFIGIIVITILGAIGALMLGHRVSQPIIELTSVVKSYSRGEFDSERLDKLKSRIKETEELQESFRNMVMERGKAEAQLRDSEAYNRMLFDTSPIGLALCRMNGSLVDINQAYADILGRSIEETLKLSYWDITPVEYAEQEERQVECLQKEGSYGPYEKEYLRQDGTRVPVLLKGFLLEMDNQKYIWSSVQDITERKQAEDAVRRMNEELERRVDERTAKVQEQAAIIDQIHDTVVVTDLQGRVIAWNKGAEQMSGYSHEEAMGRSIEFLFPEQYRPNMGEQMIAPLLEKGVHELDLVMQHHDGHQIDIHLSLTLLRDAQGQPVKMVGYALDITERKRAELAIRSAMQQAEEASRAKSEFLSRMSHELRTPMNAILGFSQLLEQNVDENLNERDLEYIDEVLKAGHHLLDLINEILDLSRIESGNMQVSLEDVDLNELAAESMALVQPIASQRSVTLSCKAEDAVLPVRADRMRLKQVILNLLSNAVKYNREGGRVDVDYSRQDGYVCLSVSDTGPGIPTAMQSRVFDPFDRLDAETTGVEGTGIGLSLAKRLTEFMGGRIGFESVEGKGSNFWIEIPSGSGEWQDHTDSKQEPVSMQSVEAKHKVLYVEDNPMNLRLIQSLVQQHGGIELYDAPGVEQAMQLIREHQFDLLLLDIQLSHGESGYDIVHKLRQQDLFGKIPLIAVSANATAKDIEHGMASGFDEYITKPINVVKFHAMLKRYLEDK